MHRLGRAMVVGAAVLAVVLVAPAPAPAQPVPETSSSDWRTVVTGGGHSCGIRTTGRLYCWGSDSDGQLGNGGDNASAFSPSAVAGGDTDWRQVSVGATHTCGRRAGRIYCWGDDTSGQLGDGGSDADQQTPTLVAGGGTNWTSVDAGGSHTCGRRATGRLYCWGSDFQGALGDDATIANRGAPRQVAGARTDWTSVSAGASHTCALRRDRRLMCWGRNHHGQVGVANGATSTPRLVTPTVTTWTSVTAGGFFTCGRRSNRRLYCWGDDLFGQLGDGSAGAGRTAPALVSGGITDWVSVSAGSQHACARRATGRLSCWGEDQSGQLGDDPPFANHAGPRPVVGGATDWTMVTAGGGTTCARIRSGRLYCWGNGSLGAIGNANDDNQPLPVQVWA